MISMTFPLPSGTVRKEVVKIKYRNCGEISKQISEVVDYFEAYHKPVTSFIYEEIRRDYDELIYCNYISEEEIRKNYEWFFENT